MNSIYDLNNRSRVVEYSDDRATGVFFDRASAQNKTITVLEGQSFTVPEGIRITSVVNYESADVSVTFDFSDIDNLGDEEFSVTWGSTPVHLTLDDSTPGIYIWSGVRDYYDWSQLIDATVELPNDYNGSTEFTVRIDYLSSYFKEYTVTVNVTNVAEWSTYDLDDFWFDTGVNSILTAPYLGDIGNPIANWTVTIYPNNYTYITLLATSGAGGTSTWDPSLKNLTLTGTNTQINSHLATLQLTTNGDVNTDFTLNYLAEGVVNGETDLTSQAMRCTLTRYLGVVRGTVDYTEEATKSIANGPLITDVDYDGSGNYTLLVTPSNSAYVKTLSSAGTGGTTNFNGTTKILTLTGTRTQVNSHINAMSMLTASDVNSNFTLNYYVTTAQSGNLVGGKNQTVNGTNTAEVSNISVDRSFINTQTSQVLFPTSIPQIVDTDTTSGITYTITFTVEDHFTFAGGSGSIQGGGTTWTYTGTKTQVNNQFSQITITPFGGWFADSTISYTQIKLIDSTFFSTQVSTTINLLGPRVAFDPVTPVNQTISRSEGATFSVPIGTNIVGVNNYAVTAPTYTINLTNCPGATLTWATVSGVTTSIISTGVYRASGIPTTTVWNAIKSPTVNLPNDFYGAFTFSATVNWTGGGSQSWTTTATISDVYPLATISGFNYTSGSTQTITGIPLTLLTDTGNTSPTWTLTVTPSRIIEGMSMSTSGGTFYAPTKTLTITGTIAQINSRVRTISLVSPATSDLTYSLIYFASNNLNTETATRTQTLTSINYTFLTATTNGNYQLNTSFNTTGGPQIVDTGRPNTDTYNLVVTAIPGNAVSGAVTGLASVYNSPSTVLEPTYVVNRPAFGGSSFDKWGYGNYTTTGDEDVWISDDGQLLAVWDTSRDQPNTSTYFTPYGEGALHIFVRNVNAWTQTQTFTSGLNIGSLAGWAISGNGQHLVIYNGRGIDDPNGGYSLLRYYTRSGNTFVLASETNVSNAALGFTWNFDRLKLSYDGTTLFSITGATAFVFVRNGTSWGHQFTFANAISMNNSGSNWTAPMDISTSGNKLVVYTTTNVHFFYRTLSTTNSKTWLSGAAGAGGWFVGASKGASTGSLNSGTVWANNLPPYNGHTQKWVSISGDGTRAAFRSGTQTIDIYVASGNNWNLETSIAGSGGGIGGGNNAFDSFKLNSDGTRLLIRPMGVNMQGGAGGPNYDMAYPDYIIAYSRTGTTWTRNSNVAISFAGNTNILPLGFNPDGNQFIALARDTTRTLPTSSFSPSGGYYGKILIFDQSTPVIEYPPNTVITITGTKAQVNGSVGTSGITITPSTGYSGSFELVYNVTNNVTARNSERNQTFTRV